MMLYFSGEDARNESQRNVTQNYSEFVINS